jgi:DNA-binding transcriptional LysR family regulator
MYRQITDWFRTAGLEPRQLDICTSVSVIMHLVAAGVAVSFLPTRMMAGELEAGRLQLLGARPPVERAGLFAAFLSAEAGVRANAVIGAAERVLATIDYLSPA